LIQLSLEKVLAAGRQYNNFSNLCKFVRRFVTLDSVHISW
jgi:hypothetical protein